MATLATFKSAVILRLSCEAAGAHNEPNNAGVLSNVAAAKYARAPLWMCCSSTAGRVHRLSFVRTLN